MALYFLESQVHVLKLLQDFYVFAFECLTGRVPMLYLLLELMRDIKDFGIKGVIPRSVVNEFSFYNFDFSELQLQLLFKV